MSDQGDSFARRSAASRQLQGILDAIQVPVWFKDTEGIYLGANQAFADYLGLPLDRIVGHSVFDVAPRELAEIYQAADRGLLEAGTTQEYESQVAYADGTRRTVVFRKAPFRDEQGRVAGLAGTMTDVTAQRRAEAALAEAVEARERAQERLAQSDRLASVGTLAAGVAHELNNPLTFVLSNLAFAVEELHRLHASGMHVEPDAVQDLERCLEEARQGADRMRVIVRDLRAFSRGDEPGHGPVEVRRALEYAIGLAWSQVRERARLVRDLAEVRPVRGSEARLGQVFLNLIVNAAHAIPEGAPGQHEVRVSTRPAAGGFVAVEVRDDGVGMTEEVRRKIFDPFFTTKPVGVGTGLGLWVCHNLVRAHGGEIEVESEPGRGTTFRVLLPEAEPPAARPATPAPAPAPPRARRPRVLVVDDEPFVGATLRRQLTADHDVDVVASPAEALRRLAGGVPFDVVICDVVMPGGGGAALREELRRTAPALAERMLFISGGITTPEAAALASSGVPWLEKPFDRRQLLEAMARLLDGAPRGAGERPGGS
ncbi:MAG: ATP-binding protein [Anaeromyxobacteraceae bacterium]|nr:ATP-binding protein [Anaeromyxobacteraceae bacterium]